jgi:hypothetical protein
MLANSRIVALHRGHDDKLARLAGHWSAMALRPRTLRRERGIALLTRDGCDGHHVNVES